LSLAEKRWAKIGGAVVHNNRCLAWAEDKSCLVCQEVCPNGAIEIVPAGELSTPAPVVKAFKCSGCGYCEQHCPVRVPAITIQPLGALRLARGSYIQAGLAAGLDLDPLSPHGLKSPPARYEGDLPPGFSE
jgi:ferredoxin